LHADAAEPESAIGMAKHTVAGQSAVAFWQLVRVLPKWVWVTLGGTALILGGSLAGDALLPAESFRRAVWSLTQLIVGLVLIFGTQIYGVIRLSSPKTGVEGREFFPFSPRLWRRILRELPATRWLVHLETWGLTLTVCATVIVGNFLYWAQIFLPHAYANEDLRKAAEARELGKDTGESTAIFSGGSNAAVLPTADMKQDSRPSVQCAIIGYVPDEDGLPTALALARLSEGKLVYCGMVKRGFLPREAEELRELLSKSVRAEPLIKGLQVDAVWVKAGAYCDVHQSGFDATGNLIDASYDRLRK
jgi:hypothetical protein